jgi:hypothetical protein
MPNSARVRCSISRICADGGLLLYGVDMGAFNGIALHDDRKRDGRLEPPSSRSSLDNLMPVRHRAVVHVQPDEPEPQTSRAQPRAPRRIRRSFVIHRTRRRDAARVRRLRAAAGRYLSDVSPDLPRRICGGCRPTSPPGSTPRWRRARSRLLTAGLSTRINEVGHVAVRVWRLRAWRPVPGNGIT